MRVCIYTYRSLLQNLTETPKLTIFLFKAREMKVISKWPTRGLCLFCLCQLISASIGSVDPQSFQIPLPSVACIAHQAISFTA